MIIKILYFIFIAVRSAILAKAIQVGFDFGKVLVVGLVAFCGLNCLMGGATRYELPFDQPGLVIDSGASLDALPDKSKNPQPDIFDKDSLVGKISLGGNVAPDGTKVQIDFPIEEDIRNIGSRVDGYGMCVDSSIEMGSRWQNLTQMRGFRDWAANERGGGYPKKVDDQIKRFCKENGIKVPPYVQYQGDSLDFLQVALKTYRVVSVTYAGRDGVRYKGPIAHMVNLVNLDGKWAAIYDNNGTPGKLIWMSRDEFRDRWLGGGNGWAFLWLCVPPPPIVSGESK